jgi:cytochrome b subunit of formate dehydrogenase
MSVPRFIMAFVAGLLACYWLLFLYVILAATGIILWDGRDKDGLNLPNLASLYGAPLIAAVLSYFTLRSAHGAHRNA